MKKNILTTMLLISASVVSFAQQPSFAAKEQDPKARPERMTLAAGVLMGGNSLVGADFEMLFTNRIGAQVGAGLGGVGAGFNVHLKPFINSSFVSFTYSHQGFGENHYAAYLGPMFVFRARKIFQAGIGFGSVVSKGDRWYKLYPKGSDEDVDVVFMFNIGVYFPLK